MTFFEYQAVLILALGLFPLFHADTPSSERRRAELSIIPKPLSVEKIGGDFRISKGTRIFYGPSGDEQRIAENLAARLRTVTGFPLAAGSLAAAQPAEGAIVLALVDGPASEGYRLASSEKGIRIEASRPAGLFYGVQTLYQLLPVEVERSAFTENVVWSVPCVRVSDEPRFPWRGMHLDVCRHFFTKDSVKRYLDMMASYKMNVFHWHLTDDQGWRIEIKKYPRLTAVGSRRSETMNDRTPYGGFYSQDDVREVVEYARQRFITVVPEIEMPGHSLAALAAYPELSCSGGPFTVGTQWGVFDDVYCAGNDKTFEFLEDVIDEVSALFPGPFFHIGGDECPKLRWSNCTQCQERIRALGLRNEQELQSYFVKRIEAMVNARGKRLVGWDEILEGGLAQNATVMSWQGVRGGIEAAKSGHDAVMTPTSACYFYIAEGDACEPKSAPGFLPTDVVYGYEPVPPDLSAENAKHVLGTEGCVWSEWIPTYRQVEYMATTRMIALSEVAWSAKALRNYEDFLERMLPHYQRLALRGINFRVPVPPGLGERNVIFQDTVVALKNPVPGALLSYALGSPGSTPKFAPYTGPITVKGDQALTTLVQLPGTKVSRTVTTLFCSADPGTNGVRYDYFEAEPVTLSGMDNLVPLRSDKIFDVNLAGLSHRWGSYGFRFTCLVDIPASASYALYLQSDYSCKLYLDDRMLIDNDGFHGIVEVNGKAFLTKGKHRLAVRCVQTGTGSGLNVYIEGPGMQKQSLPPKMLSIE